MASTAAVETRRRWIAQAMHTGQTIDAIHAAWNRHANQRRERGETTYRPVSRTTIVGDTVTIREWWRDQARKSQEAWIADDLATLAEAQNRLMATIMDRNTATRDLNATIRSLLQLLARRAKLLGLDAPDRVVLIEADIDRELDRLTRELRAMGEEVDLDAELVALLATDG